MANEITVPTLFTSGNFQFSVQNSVSQWWNTNASAFENYNASNIANYGIAMTQQGTSGNWVGGMPACPAGVYLVKSYQTATSTLAVSDLLAIVGIDPAYQWSGSAEVALYNAPVNVTQILGTASQGAAGYVGIDWSKIDNPAATVDLSNTTMHGVDVTLAANVVAVNGTTFIGANVPAVLANGVAHGGSTATMELGSSSAGTPALLVQNPYTGGVAASFVGGLLPYTCTLGHSGNGGATFSSPTTGFVAFGTQDYGITAAGATAGMFLSGGPGGGDLYCGGLGTIYADILGNLIGAGSGGGPSGQAFGGVGVQADVEQWAAQTVSVDANNLPLVDLASTGLDNIPTTAPTGVAGTFREMIVQTWRRWFRKADTNATTATTGTLKTYADDNTTVLTTQAVSTTGDLTDDVQGSAS